MPTVPRLKGALENSCFRFRIISSRRCRVKFCPSPVCAMKPSITRWKRATFVVEAFRRAKLLDALGRASAARSVRSLITMRPLVVSMTIAFCLSRLAGKGLLRQRGKKSEQDDDNEGESGGSWKLRVR